MSQIKDLSGMRFGRLVVMKRGEDRIKPCGKKIVRWECKCDCGNEVTVSRDSLMSGNTKSCGCLHSEQLSERNVRSSNAELVGQKFGRLTVVGIEKNIKNNRMWKCICECGNICIASTNSLRRGKVTSCGCKRKENMPLLHENNITHGKSKSRLYRIWNGMKSRCNNPNYEHYKDYGARGISVCKEWSDSFETFENWALNNGYQENLTIDRRDNDGNYEPGNCRWVTRADNNRNKGRKSKGVKTCEKQAGRFE